MSVDDQLKLVLFCHPGFHGGQSPARFARMLREGFEARGHDVRVLCPPARWHRYWARTRLAKWAGYIDQYVLFPRSVRRALKELPPETLFVFCDQALGPWVPLVANRPNVVHVHDLLALRSALDEFPENPTSFTGKLYQRYIRRGFRHSKHFISISKKSREDLHRFGKVLPLTSEVVYNGLAYPYSRLDQAKALEILRSAALPAETRGMLLHVGGDQWYKNRPGIVALYSQYAARVSEPLPLWFFGPGPTGQLKAALDSVPSNARVMFFQDLDDKTIQAAYSHASAFLFPSLAEGFGWPLVEALACGCPVITTADAPMSEIGGTAVRYLPRLTPGGDIVAWSSHGADVLLEMLKQNDMERTQSAQQRIAWAGQFKGDTAIERYLDIYRCVLRQYSEQRSPTLA